MIETATNNKERPDFSEYYVCQVFKSRYRRTALNKTTNKRYREVHYALFEYIYIFQCIIIAFLTLFLAYQNDEGFSTRYMFFFFLCEIAFMLLYPLRYFFIKFEEIDTDHFGSPYKPEVKSKCDHERSEPDIHIDGEY